MKIINNSFCKRKNILGKIFFIILLLNAFTGLSAQNQKITISNKELSIQSAFEEIEKQTGMTIAFNESTINVNQRISVDIENLPLKEMMVSILKGTGMTFNIKGKQIVIVSGTEKGQQPPKRITGSVRDDKGEPIIGASIQVKGTLIGTITDIDGNFSLEATPQSVLVITYLGYLPKEIQTGNKDILDVKLIEDVKTLEEVVVVGYGTNKRQQITSSIASVKMNSIDQGSTYDAVKMLQGRVSGVNILNSSGIPGSKPIAMIRGVGSISGGSQPLYVVDGVPSETYPNINPNDIESMDVLKDASAAAIYGSRANSGVIIITTKSAKSEQTTVEFSGHTGFGNVSHNIEMANSQQYAEVIKAAVDNYNAQKGTSLSYYQPSAIQETNWVDVISRDRAQTSVANLSVSGGSSKTKFYTSFGYYNQQGMLLRSNFDQYSGRLKMSHVINPYFKLNMNISGSYSDQQLLEEESTSLKVLRTAREEQPWYNPYKEDGTYKVNGTYILRHNPLMLINEEDWTRKRMEGVGNFSLDFTPFEGFKYTPAVSVFGTLVDERKKLTENMVARSQSAGWGALAQDRNLGLRYVIDNIVSYVGSWDKLDFNAMGGYSFEKYTNDRLGAYSDNYKNGAYPSSGFDVINAGPNIYPSNGIGYDAYTLESYLARVSLDYNKRYLFNASVRVDGSSKFSKNERYGTFPSLSLGWRITEESFFPKNNVLTDMKLRASWGMTGSMAGIGYYSPLSLVSAGESYNNQGGLIVSQDAQDVTWEKAEQLNFGFDAELWKGRLYVNLDYFVQTTTDLLYYKPIYSTSGYTSIPSNIGSLRNNGLELSLNGKILTGDFKWDMSGNISFVQNELLSLYGGTDMYIVPASGSNLLGGQMHALINGKPIGAFYMYEQLGIYQRDEDVPAPLYKKGVCAGDVKYADLDNDGDITDADRDYVGKATPDFYGGINTNFAYKGFDLNIFGQFSVGGKVMAAWRGANGTEGTDHLGNALSNVTVDNGQKVEQFFNIRKEMYDTYWRGPGTSNTTPRPVRQGVFSGYNYGYNNLTSTRFLEDASYFKIKTVTLGYSLPTHILEKIKSSGLRIFVSADNLLTFTKYSGYDPEQSFTANPGDANYGVDFGLQSTLRTFIIGANLKF